MACFWLGCARLAAAALHEHFRPRTLSELAGRLPHTQAPSTLRMLPHCRRAAGAAAIAAGVAAQYLELHKNASATEVRRALLELATPGVVVGPGVEPGAGLLYTNLMQPAPTELGAGGLPPGAPNGSASGSGSGSSDSGGLSNGAEAAIAATATAGEGEGGRQACGAFSLVCNPNPPCIPAAASA